MKFSEFFKSKDTIQLDKKTLVTLRWMAIIGQLITILIVYCSSRWFECRMSNVECRMSNVVRKRLEPCQKSLQRLSDVAL